MFPAAFDLAHVVGVGGINERGVWFGNRGRHTIDVVAPAQRIPRPTIGADLAMLNYLVQGSARIEEGTPRFDLKPDGEGTSEATAYVATVAALLRAHGPTSQLDGAALRRLLMASGSELPSLPWMWILRQASTPDLQARHWLMLGPFEPTTRTAKQTQLADRSRSGRMVRLDRALDCDGARFERLVAPVPRLVTPQAPLRVAAESFVCAEPYSATHLSARVRRPDGVTESIVLWPSARAGLYELEYSPDAPGRYRFSLEAAPDDVLEVLVESIP